MPPSKKAPADPDPNRLRTRAANANAHPGTAAKDASRARNPSRDPDVIQKEKADKEAKKLAKQKALEENQAKEDSAMDFIDEYRARKETEALNENTAMPRQKPKGQCLTYFKLNNQFLYSIQLAWRLLVDVITPQNLSQQTLMLKIVIRYQMLSTTLLNLPLILFLRPL